MAGALDSMLNDKLFKELLNKLDSYKLEEYFPSETEAILGDTVKNLKEKMDKDTEKFVQLEWMLLNNRVGFGITNKWKYILEQARLGDKPSFWNYDGETINYFKSRLTSDIPKITSAHINYYLWTATKEFRYAEKAMADFEIAMEEHCKTGESRYFQTGLFCGRFILKMMIKFKLKDRIKTTFLPKIVALIKLSTVARCRVPGPHSITSFLGVNPNFQEFDRVPGPHSITSFQCTEVLLPTGINETEDDLLLRRLIELGFDSIKNIKNDETTNSTGVLLVDLCNKKIKEMINEGFDLLAFGHSKPHQNPLEGFDGHTKWGLSKPSNENAHNNAIAWIEPLELYAKETTNTVLLTEIQNQHLAMLIARADVHPPQFPSQKSRLYHAALRYYWETGMNNSAVESELKKSIAENMNKPEAGFKAEQASVAIPPNEKLDSAIDEICGDINDNQKRIFRLAEEILIPTDNDVTGIVESNSSGIASPFPKLIQTKDHMSKPYASNEDKKKYEALSATTFLLQIPEIFISRALEKYGINEQDFTAILNQTQLPSNTKTVLTCGIERHFAGDYISSLHILCPQIEELLRLTIKDHGGETIVFDKKTGSINQKLLSKLVRDTTLQQVLGANACMAINAYYAHPDSYKLRHKISHGFIELDELNEKNSIITLFIIIYIIKNQLNHRTSE